MLEDLSNKHHLLSDLFHRPRRRDEWDRYRLSNEQVHFYHRNGYLAGIRMLNDEQVDLLREELSALVDPSHPGRELFYEYNSNESTVASTMFPVVIFGIFCRLPASRRRWTRYKLF